MSLDKLKVFSIFLIFALVLNLVFFALGKVNVTAFWVVIAFAGTFSFVLNRHLKKK